MRKTTVLWAGLALVLAPGAGRAEEKVLSLEEVSQPNPCNQEPLDFKGDLRIETRSSVQEGASGSPGSPREAEVNLKVDANDLRAVGETSGNAYRTEDVLEADLDVGPLPAAGTAETRLSFSGPGEERFIANVMLDMSIDQDGQVEANLGPVRLECDR